MRCCGCWSAHAAPRSQRAKLDIDALLAKADRFMTERIGSPKAGKAVSRTAGPARKRMTEREEVARAPLAPRRDARMRAAWRAG